jgi:hypothetical protein
LAGTSQVTHHADLAAVFQRQQDHPPLRTPSPRSPRDLLPGSIRRDGAVELLKGAGVAAAALLVPTVVANGDLEGGAARRRSASR